MSVSTPSVPVAAPIFLITHEFYPMRGGIATFTEEIAKASAHLGYDVEVWAQSAPSQFEKTWPFRLRRLPLKGSHDLWCQIRLAWQLILARRQLRHAIVYLPEPGPMMTMMLLQFFRAFRPRRLVLTFHGSEILKFSESGLRRWLAGRLIRHASRVSTLTNYTQELLLEAFPEAADKIFLTPGALRTDFAVVPQKPVSRSKEKIIVLTVGRLHPRKGQLLTLRALQTLAPAVRARLEYWIVGRPGKGDYGETLRAAAATADFPVKLLGNVPDDELAEIYERADIFAMTSVYHGHSVEGFGLVYLEAAAHGLPVVAHDVGGVSEAVNHGITGILVPPDRPAQLAAAFEQLIHDDTLRHQMGDAGRAWAGRNCWRQSAEALFGQPEADA
jgi:glycosyltransferase involved in cell wall biosynthesis